jgi:hypothetical protein
MWLANVVAALPIKATTFFIVRAYILYFPLFYLTEGFPGGMDNGFFFWLHCSCSSLTSPVSFDLVFLKKEKETWASFIYNNVLELKINGFLNNLISKKF